MQDYEYLMGVTDEEFLNELNSALTRPPQMLLPKVFKENLENVPVVTQICNKRMAFPLT